MKVSKERLSVIGKMIGIYREEKRANTQNNWTQIKFCENICSPNTLKSIESGGVARSSEVYDHLLERFNLKLGEFPVIDEAVNSLLEKLYVAIEYFDDKEIDSLTAKGIKVLDTAKEYIYYSELFSIFQDIKNYYLNGSIINDKKVHRYINEFILFTYKLKNILILLIYARLKFNSIFDFDEYETFINSNSLVKNKWITIKLNLLHYYYVSEQRFIMLDEIDTLEKELIENDNVNRLCDVYNLAILVMSDMDQDRSLLYIKKAKNLTHNKIITKSKLAEVNANIAAFYYTYKNYKDALNYMVEAIKYRHHNLLNNYLVMADCQNHLHISINIPKMSKKELASYPTDLKIMYQYFYSIQEDGVPPFVKQKIIMKHIVPVLNDKLLIEIFRFELNKIVTETNSYKTLHLFEKIINEKGFN